MAKAKAAAVHGNSSSSAGPSSRPQAPYKGRREDAVPLPSTEIIKSRSTEIQLKSTKSKARSKASDPSASFPDFVTPCIFPSLDASYDVHPTTSRYAETTPPSRLIAITSSQTLVGSPKKYVRSPAKRKRPASHTAGSTAKSRMKHKSPDSDRTAGSSSLTPLSSPPHVLKSSFMLDNEDSDEEDLSEQDLAKFIQSLESKEEESTELIVQSKMEMETFRPSRLPDGVHIDSSIYVKHHDRWWPARVLDFSPADSLRKQKAGKDRWKVEDRFGDISEQPRAHIITMYDAEIATCTLGEMKVEKRQYLSSARTRPASPPLDDSEASMPPKVFRSLDRVEQLRCIRHHLQRIIEETYEPAQGRIRAFFASEKTRHKLSQEAQYGDVTEDEVYDLIIPELERWAVRGSRPRSAEETSEGLVRPTGSDRYNKLGPSLLRAYIQDILVPESLIEICIRTYGDEDLLAGDVERQDEEDEDVGVDEHRVAVSDDIQSVALQKRSRPEKVYIAARRRLDHLAQMDSDKAWSIRSTELRSARRRMREKVGMPEEHMNEHELRLWKIRQGMKEGWAGSRVQLRKNYEESEGSEASEVSEE